MSKRRDKTEPVEQHPSGLLMEVLNYQSDSRGIHGFEIMTLFFILDNQHIGNRRAKCGGYHIWGPSNKTLRQRGIL